MRIPGWVGGWGGGGGGGGGGIAKIMPLAKHFIKDMIDETTLPSYVVVIGVQKAIGTNLLWPQWRVHVILH